MDQHGFKKFLLITPVIFTIHNIEEALSMAEWSVSVPSMIHPPVFSEQFAAAVAMLSILGFAVTALAWYLETGKYYIPIMNAFCALMFLNAFFPHILATVLYQKYAPGVISSLLINLPFTGYALSRIYRQNLVSHRVFAATFITGPVAGSVLAALSLMAGKYMAAYYLV